MLDNEDVDDDYFTPVAKTSLASIFKKSESGEKSENESLKYTPPVPKPVEKVEESTKKPYETVFSCVFDAFLWLDNVYTNKGKLGCAIVKHHNADGIHSFHTILLYDSKKATVSSAIANKDLEVTVKGNVLSYYDRYEKYWCLNGTDNDLKKILEILNMCNVQVKVITTNIFEQNAVPPQNKTEAPVDPDENKKIIESDTDSSINRKTKASILNRMANMGQSVLPTRTVTNEQTSDSSDPNDCENQVVAVRHKPVKSIKKPAIPDKNILNSHSKSDPKKVMTSTAQDVKTVVAFDNQIMPVQSTISLASSSSQDLNYFFTEQRIANSELRINMTRVTDKVDDILNKVNSLERSKPEGNAINIEIYQKLIKEYEGKIKAYEELFQKNNKGHSSVPKQDISKNEADHSAKMELNSKVKELSNCLEQKDLEISDLNSEIVKLKGEKLNTEKQQQELEGKLSEYTKEQDKHKDMLLKLSDENKELLNTNNDKIEQKIKSIMNDTFRAIEVNFDGDESYSGGEIKNIIATVIKRVTIEALDKEK